jgi:hypothetical protein
MVSVNGTRVQGLAEERAKLPEERARLAEKRARLG